jgi:hypothetical protein
VSDAPIRLVISDVDGTLVTPSKTLTDEAVQAVEHLRESNIFFSVTSSRPPRGFAMLIDPLELTAPLGAFNGGLIVDCDLNLIHKLAIDEDLVSPIIEALSASGVSVWVYQGTEWYVLDLDGPHVARESDVVQFRPTQLDSFDGIRHDVIKVAGVSDDPEAIAKGQSALRGFDVSATTSQTYYLDVTNPRANKGFVVEFLAAHFSIDTDSVATIGDMTNDVAMFERAGFSIAMGNATDEVKSKASTSTRSNKDNGFAHAIEHFILPGAAS